MTCGTGTYTSLFRRKALRSGAVLWCAQSILTGESGSVAKFVGAVSARKAVYQDKTCLLFSVRPQSPVMRATGVG